MNKKIKILIVGLVLLIGNNVMALDGFSVFQTSVAMTQYRTIDLNNYVNPLVFTATLTVGGDKTFIGASGENFATLDGNSSLYLKFTIGSNKTLHFQNNFIFMRFIDNRIYGNNHGGAIYNSGTIHFSSSIVNFNENSSAGLSGGAIYNSGTIHFSSSIVNFIGNSAANNGGAIFLINSTMSFSNSVVHFSNNVSRSRSGLAMMTGGGAIKADRSSISFTNSAVNFSNNMASNGGAIWSDPESDLKDTSISFTNSTSTFIGNVAQSSGGAIFVSIFFLNVDIKNSISFTNSSVAFAYNNSGSGKGAAIYIERSTISFINTNASFIGNSGDQALYARNSQIKISGDMEFSANTNGDIGLEGSNLIFMPESGKTIKFKGEIAAEGTGNTILKAGGGKVVFSSEIPLHISNINFLIAQGAAHLGASSNTFSRLEISSAGILGISVDWTLPETLISALYIDDFVIESGAALSVKTIGIAATGSSAAFVYANTPDDDFENMRIIGGSYNYSLSWDDEQKVGYLILKGIQPPNPSIQSLISSLNISPVFIANSIRASAISDNSSIYSNIDEKAWLAVQINGGNLADDDLGDFKNSAVGAKAGYRVFSEGGKTAGVFAGFGSRAYKQGSNKATASDIDFGAYGSWSAAEKVGLAGFLGYGLQAVKVEGGGSSAEFDATVIKFGAKAEYAAGLISPFLGLEGAIINTDDVNLGGATLEAAAYTRLSSQIGAKIDKKAGKLAWFGRAYVDLLLAGAKPQYNVKPDVDGAKSQTIDGTAENAASFGLGAGGSLPVSATIDVFANADIKLGGGYFGYQTNVGGRFRF